MKRVTALVLALVALLTWTLACAESTGTQIRLKSMKVSYIQNEDEYVRLHGVRLYVTAGSTEDIPTLQVSLDYGDDQELESVLQVVGSQLVFCLGGINGTYYVDLEQLFDEPGKGILMATGVGTALKLFGADPNALLDATVHKSKRGYYTVSFELPVEQIRETVGQLLGEQEDADAPLDTGLQSLLEVFSQSDEPIELEFRYKPTRRFYVYIRNGENGIKLSAHVKETTGEVDLYNVSADEMKHNLLDLDQETKDELIGEFEFLGIKLGSFVRHTNLSRLVNAE